MHETRVYLSWNQKDKEVERLPWVERKFQFDLPVGWLPNVISRLAGTSIRLKHYCNLISEKEAGKRFEGKWSIKEHIGHLVDLEYLHTGRLEDFKNRETVLRPADMSNAQTEEANHNETLLSELVAIFEQKRGVFLSTLKNLSTGDNEFRSMHPRLNEMMRPVDIAYFTAEHDDHHLTSIVEIIDQIN